MGAARRRPAAIAAFLLVGLFAGRGERYSVRQRHGHAAGGGVALRPHEAARSSSSAGPAKGRPGRGGSRADDVRPRVRATARRRAAAAALWATAQSFRVGAQQLERWTGEDLHRMLDRNQDGKVDREEYLAHTMDTVRSLHIADEDAVASLVEFTEGTLAVGDIDGDGFYSPREIEFIGYLASAEVMSSPRFMSQRTIERLLAEEAAADAEAAETKAAAEGGEAVPAPEASTAAAASTTVAAAAGEAAVGDRHESPEPPSDAEEPMYHFYEDFGARGYTAVLREMDTNGDGLVDWAEFQIAFRAAYPDWGLEKPVGDYDVYRWMRKIWKMAEVTGDEKLNVRELQFADLIISHAVGKRNPSEYALATAWLRDLDADRDGRLSREELVQAVKEYQEHLHADKDGPPAEPGAFNFLLEDFSAFDADGDGALDEEELQRLAGSMMRNSLQESGLTHKEEPEEEDKWSALLATWWSWLTGKGQPEAEKKGSWWPWWGHEF